MRMQFNGMGAGVVSGVVGVLLLFGFTGCAQVLGLEDWQDPPASTSGAGGSGASSSTAGPKVFSGTATSGGAGGEGGSGPTCADGRRNGPETDVDCGGDSCLPCHFGQDCQNDGDCATLKCGEDKKCAERPAGRLCDPVDDANPACSDCQKNGFETDTDCGGDACSPCPDGKLCDNDADCKSGRCPAVDSGTKVCAL
jgi:hypothetical protein